jgi:glucose 1-dehydrogenase
MKFSGKAAIVTGAGNGIGFEIARQLVLNGANVILNDIDADLARRAAENLSLYGHGRCIAVAGDAGTITCIKKMVNAGVLNFGRVDMAVANASNTLFGNFFEFSVEDFQKVINLNLQGPFFLAQHAAKQMCAQNSGGRIILISSTIGLRAYPLLAVYSMTKAALHMMAKSLVLDLSCHDITINAVAPGATITDRTLLEDPEYERKWSELIPNGKPAIPEDVAKAVLFLLSEDATHITGHTLVVDGGWTAISQNPNIESLNKKDVTL